MLWNIRELTVKVTFEITVSFKILIWMEPEMVFAKTDGVDPKIYTKNLIVIGSSI